MGAKSTDPLTSSESRKAGAPPDQHLAAQSIRDVSQDHGRGPPDSNRLFDLVLTEIAQPIVRRLSFPPNKTQPMPSSVRAGRDRTMDLATNKAMPR